MPIFKIYPDELLSAWKQGVLDFNEGRYWHAHESWELGWKTLPDPERTYIQALIQVAAVYHLLGKGRTRPALALCESALAKFSRTLPMLEVLPRIEISDAMELLKTILEAPESRPQPKAVLLLPRTV